MSGMRCGLCGGADLAPDPGGYLRDMRPFSTISITMRPKSMVRVMFHYRDAEDGDGRPYLCADCRNRPSRPAWTVRYNISSPESGKWVGTGWEFFDSEGDARRCYDRHAAAGNCPTRRPFHESDAPHLGAAHRPG